MFNLIFCLIRIDFQVFRAAVTPRKLYFINSLKISYILSNNKQYNLEFPKNCKLYIIL